MRRRLGTEVRNVFDTQVAAGFAGMAAQASYETLLSELLDVRVAKSASFTRWDARPLSPEQREYAREDVVHLLELAGALERRLAELGTPGVGARGVRAAVPVKRRARPGDGVRATAAGAWAERSGADDRARAGALARGRRGHQRSARAEGPRGRGARGDRQAQADLARQARADPRRQPGQPAPARAGPAGDGAAAASSCRRWSGPCKRARP